MTALAAGFGLGLGVAAGFGPINLLCLSSGVRYGFWPAYGVGVGAAIVDGLYALLAGLGAAALLTGEVASWLQLLGGAALLVIAARMVFGRRRSGNVRSVPTFGASLRLSLGATLANPLTIVSWSAVFAAVVPGLDLGRTETLALLPSGIGTGALTWFTGVSVGSAVAGRFAGERVLEALSRIAAVAIAGFGVWFVVRGIAALR